MDLPNLTNVWSVGRPLAIHRAALIADQWNVSANAGVYQPGRGHTTPEPAGDPTPPNDPIPTEVPPLDPVPVQDPIPHQEPLRARLSVV